MSLLKRASSSLLLASLALLAGCTDPPPKLSPRYPTLEPRVVPDYLQDTVLQYTDLAGTEPFPVSGYGLVVHLHGTGGSRVPTPVRDYMIKELARHDFGSIASGWESPEAVLNSRNVAIVRVDGVIPPGARAGTDWSTWFDVRVSIPSESDASSLAHGDLYQTDLKINGANPAEPGGGVVAIRAQAAGSVFINPSFVVDSSIDTPEARQSRKSGVVLAGARVIEDRPLLLRLRAPGNRMARAIETRIIERFQTVVDEDLRADAGSDHASSKKVANAVDEGLVNVYVPKAYANDWQHFAGIVRHLYMQGDSPEFAAMQARKLADAAVQPGAYLEEISYAWEGLGKPALYALTPLLSSEKPDVQFAAARAAAFLDDPAGVPVLISIANSQGNPFRVNAVQVLGQLPGTPGVDRMCRTLLDSDQATVRVEAYKLLAKHEDPSVYSRWVKDKGREVFALDLVHSSGKPLIYASSQGVPRIAIFGSETQLELPLVFTSMDDRLTISSDALGSKVTIFYRGNELPKPITVFSTQSIPEIVALLAGDSESAFRGLHFSYSDVVGVLQQLTDQKRISGLYGQERLLASFMLQEQAKTIEPYIPGRPLLRDTGSRPQGDQPAPAEKPVDDHLLRHPTTAPVAVR
jgi:flagellar basal body P-ring protein FlgI